MGQPEPDGAGRTGATAALLRLLAIHGPRSAAWLAETARGQGWQLSVAEVEVCLMRRKSRYGGVDKRGIPMVWHIGPGLRTKVLGEAPVVEVAPARPAYVAPRPMVRPGGEDFKSWPSRVGAELRPYAAAREG